MVNIEIQDIASYSSTKADTTIVHINGKKTNIWWRLPNYKFYNNYSDDDRSRKKNEVFLKLIKDGKIVSDNYENFDYCSSYNFIPKSIIVLQENDQRVDHNFLMFSLKGYEDYSNENLRKEIIQKYTNQNISSQYSNLIDFDKGVLHENLGICFHKYGYNIYSI